MNNDLDDRKIFIDYSNLHKYLKNTSPYIFVDQAEIIPGQSAYGIKNFTHNEWFFQCHFPDSPIVPGVFQIEAITQTAALAIHILKEMEGKKILVRKIVNVDFIKGVFPGDQLCINSSIQSFKRGIIKAFGEAYVIRKGRKEVTCKAEFQMVVPDMFISVSSQK